jgi:hypothetical protein
MAVMLVVPCCQLVCLLRLRPFRVVPSHIRGRVAHPWEAGGTEVTPAASRIVSSSRGPACRGGSERIAAGLTYLRLGDLLFQTEMSCSWERCP